MDRPEPFARVPPRASVDAGTPYARPRTSEVPADDPAYGQALERGRNWPELLEHLFVRAERAGNPAERAALMRHAAGVFEGPLGDPERAFLTLVAAFEHDPTSVALISDLERLAARTGRWEALLAAADAAVAQVHAPEAAADLWARMARWCAGQAWWELAARCAQRALTLDPHHEGALGELEEVHRRQGHAGALARVLLRRARLLGQLGEEERAVAVALLLEAAGLYEDHVQDVEQAIVACEAVLRLDAGNRAALTRLERLADKTARQPLLVEVLTRRAAHATTAAEMTEVGARLARAWEALGRPDTACEVLERMLARREGEGWAYRELARLHRGTHAWSALVDVLGRHLRVAAADVERIELAVEAAEVLWRRLARPADAAALLEQALAAAPGHLEALLLLAGIRQTQADWSAAASLLVQAGQHAPDAAARVQHLAEAAATYRDRLDDGRQALQLWGLIHELDRGHRQAANALLEHAAFTQDWTRVAALSRALVKQHPGAPAGDRARWYARLARAAEETGDTGAALAAHRWAAALAPDERAFVQPAATFLWSQRSYGEAIALYERLVRETELPAAEAADLCYRLGSCRAAVGQLEGGLQALRAALELDPGHLPALEALAATSAQAGEFRQAASWLAQLARRTTAVDRRLTLARQLASLQRHHLGSPEEAAHTLREALVIAPSSPPVLHDLLEVEVELGAWRRAVTVLQALSKHAATPAERARCLAMTGTILEHRLHAWSEAARAYSRSLDDDPGNGKTWARLCRVLGARQAWDELAREHRRLIERLGGREEAWAAELRRSAWRGLGEIYRRHLGDAPAAIAALETAARLDPDDRSARLAVAELCEEAGPVGWGRALEARQSLLSNAASVEELAEGLRAIFRLAANRHDVRRGVEATAGLVALGVATPDEHAFFAANHTDAGLGAPLSTEAWRDLQHPDEDPRLSLLFSTAARALVRLRARAARRYGLGRQSAAQAEATASSALATLAGEVAALLRVPAAVWRFRPDLVETIVLPVKGGGAVQPLIVAGADLLAPRPRRQLVFLAARQVAMLRPDHQLLWPGVTRTVGELHHLVRAFRHLFGQPTPADGAAPAVAMTARWLRSALSAEELELAYAALVALGHAEPDVDRWVRGAFLTAGRAALLVCGDLSAAARVLASCGLGPVRVSPFEQLRDLVSWTLARP